MTAPVQGERRRKWAPKVRTGCLTCKKRKKRCGEEKPICLQCARGKYICDGYQIPKTPVKPAEKIEEDTNCFVEDSHVSTPLRDDSTESTPTSFLSDTDRLAEVEDNDISSSEISVGDACSPAPPSRYLNAILTMSDRNHVQFFVVTVGPTLSTTNQWRSFWENTVPCLSTHRSSIYHAMVALGAAYESRARGAPRAVVATHKVNLAIRAFLSQPLDVNQSLVLCRLLASISQCAMDWNTAVLHLQHGWKIMVENVRRGNLDPEVVQLFAPTFLCGLRESACQLYKMLHANPVHQRIFEQLEDIRMEFVERLPLLKWREVHLSRRTFVVVCWSVLTRVSCYLLCPGSFDYSIDRNGALSAEDLKDKLRSAGVLLELSELRGGAISVLENLATYLECSESSEEDWAPIKRALRHLVENYVVQAAEIHPGMEIDIFRCEQQGDVCQVDDLLDCRDLWARRATSLATGVPSTSEVDRRSKEHYLEFVCPYRSGLMPGYDGQM